MDEKVSGSRLRRLGRIVWTSRQMVPLAVSRWRGRGEAGTEEDPAVVRAAEELLGTLGDLKGLALKVGQMLSYMDGALPAEAEPVYRRVLAKLQREAPSLPWDAARGVLEEELGDVSAHFAQIDPEPFAAASIGQVHRASLLDGTAVAVKIQYPGVDRAILADLKNIEGVRSMAGPVLTALGAGSNAALADNVLEELRARLLEELDYEHEAAMQARFGAMFSTYEDIVVPRVYPEASTRRVLTTRFEEGASLDEVAEVAPDPLRQRWALALTRAVSDQLYVHHLFNADPHPGNVLFRPDGKVVLLDFGCVKVITPEMATNMRAHMRTAIQATRTDDPDDWKAFEAAFVRSLRLEDAEQPVIDLVGELLLYALRPALRDEVFEFTSEYTAGINDLVLEGKRKLVFGDGRLPRIPKVPAAPGDYTFINRLQWGFYSVLTRLGARLNWHRLLPEDLRVCS
jgi:predicted unusual protein kinase regulating ubiquinone biosynthesis (AarF/ABC1/UbiB family)